MHLGEVSSLSNKLSKITVIGLGLIGGSIVKALHASSFDGEIVGIDADLRSVAYGLQHKLITSGGTEINALVKGSDLVIIATHLRFYEEIIGELLALDSSLLITDVGSVKKCDFIHDYVKNNKLNFIGGHPLAGSEKTGFENGVSSLFVDKPYYIIPFNNKVSDTAKVLELVGLIGAKASIMDSEEHDTLMSLTSHVPHLLAALQVNLLSSSATEGVLEHVGEGFKDATRIASSSPDLWSDIVLMNKNEILTQVNKLKDEMNVLSDLLEQEDRNGVYDFFQKASDMRSRIS